LLLQIGSVLEFVQVTVAPAGLGLNDVALALHEPALTVAVPAQLQLIAPRVTQIAPAVGGWYMKYV
jgi:hypothetical protein